MDTLRMNNGEVRSYVFADTLQEYELNCYLEDIYAVKSPNQNDDVWFLMCL